MPQTWKWDKKGELIVTERAKRPHHGSGRRTGHRGMSRERFEAMEG